MEGIPLYTEINALHDLTGTRLRASHPLYHCFDMADANDLQVSGLPPHRVTLYMLALNYGTQALEYSLNQQVFKNPEHFLLFVAPGQVARWEKRGDWAGYCIFLNRNF